MTDVLIVAITIACGLVLAGYVALCERVRG